jgi:hypothetical protein
MSAPDPLIDAYVAGLDLVPVQMAITAAGAAIGIFPLTGAMQSRSVIFYCKRHMNIERLMVGVRSEFTTAPTLATLPALVSAMLKWAEAVGVTIQTEKAVRIAAAETIAHMEAELAHLQSAGGLPAINRSLQNDAAVAEAWVSGWQRIMLSWLDGVGKGRWHDRAVILHRVGMTALTASVAIIKTQWANTVRNFGDCVFRWADRGECLTILMLRYLSLNIGHAARQMAHRRRLYDR